VLVYFIFSNVKQFSGAVDGGGTTASEFLNSSFPKIFYIKLKLFHSSIQIFTQNCQKLNIKAWIYALLIENFEQKT
jgi:hypothetical protein